MTLDNRPGPAVDAASGARWQPAGVRPLDATPPAHGVRCLHDVHRSCLSRGHTSLAWVVATRAAPSMPCHLFFGSSNACCTFFCYFEFWIRGFSFPQTASLTMGRGVELILAVLTVWLAWVPFSPHAALLRRIPIGSTVGANVQVQDL